LFGNAADERILMQGSDSRMVGYSEAATCLGVPVGTIYAWVARRQIPHHRLGPRLVRFDRDELEAWLERKRVQEQTEGGAE
jgi:excisionase family DNA binding protein